MHELNPGADKDTVALKPTAPRRHYYQHELRLDMPTFRFGGPRRPKSGNLWPSAATSPSCFPPPSASHSPTAAYDPQPTISTRCPPNAKPRPLPQTRHHQQPPKRPPRFENAGHRTRTKTRQNRQQRKRGRGRTYPLTTSKRQGMNKEGRQRS